MINGSEAFLFLLEVDKELADDLGEESLASEIAEAIEIPSSQFRGRTIDKRLGPLTHDVWHAVSRPSLRVQRETSIFEPLRREVVDAAVVDEDDLPVDFEVPEMSLTDDRVWPEATRRQSPE